tara:strand:+ start:251 stop:457 length:207 start_codon:yes stop_codon:yes gene_type:complete
MKSLQKVLVNNPKHYTKRIFEVSPDELLDGQNLEQLKQELAKRLKIRRDLREKKQQQELFDPNKPMKG